jgi:hypothetical protein
MFTLAEPTTPGEEPVITITFRREPNRRQVSMEMTVNEFVPNEASFEAASTDAQLAYFIAGEINELLEKTYADYSDWVKKEVRKN